MRIVALAPATGAMLALSAVFASAAGPYDGTWQIQAPQSRAAANLSNPQGCEPVQFQLQVKDSQIQGSLKRQTLGRARVEASPAGEPVTGSVAADGTVSAQWENYIVTGKLTGNTGELRWNGPCGARVATGTRVSGTGSTSR